MLTWKGFFSLSEFAFSDLLDVQTVPFVKIVVKPPKLNTKRLKKLVEAGELLLVGGNEMDWAIFNDHTLFIILLIGRIVDNSSNSQISHILSKLHILTISQIKEIPILHVSFTAFSIPSY